MAQRKQTGPRAGSREALLEELLAAAQTLGLRKLRSALDYVRFLGWEEEDKDLPPPDQDELADVEAFYAGDITRFVTVEEARRQLDA